MLSLDTPNALSADATNLDQLANPAINMVNAHVKQDSKEINALNVLLQTTMVSSVCLVIVMILVLSARIVTKMAIASVRLTLLEKSAILVIVIKSVLSAIDVTKMAIASVRLRLQEENAQYVTASRN